VKFTSSGMGKVALVVAVILEQNHEMHRPEGNSLTFNWKCQYEIIFWEGWELKTQSQKVAIMTLKLSDFGNEINYRLLSGWATFYSLYTIKLKKDFELFCGKDEN